MPCFQNQIEMTKQSNPTGGRLMCSSAGSLGGGLTGYEQGGPAHLFNTEWPRRARRKKKTKKDKEDEEDEDEERRQRQGRSARGKVTRSGPPQTPAVYPAFPNSAAIQSNIFCLRLGQPS
jgi:hypothetical protein